MSAWFVDGGHAELARLSATIVAVGHASTFAAQGAACAELAAAVASAQVGPPVPDAAAETLLASALAEFGERSGLPGGSLVAQCRVDE